MHELIWLLTGLGLLAGIPLGALLCAAMVILWGVRGVSETNADVIIVLGARVWGDKPSPVFQERIRHGVDLYKRGLAPRILMTGGKGGGTRLAEAEAACRLATEWGVPQEALLQETFSTTTFENMVEARRVMLVSGLRSAIIVTDPLHTGRAMAMARKNGIRAQPSPTPTTRYISLRKRATFLWRESVSLVMFWVLGY